METTIQIDSAVTTLVNVFTVEPDDRPKVSALLQESVETIFDKMPSWISSNLLKSRDGKRVLVYSQWRDDKDIDAFRGDPRLKAYFQQFDALAKHETRACDVAYVLHV